MKKIFAHISTTIVSLWHLLLGNSDPGVSKVLSEGITIAGILKTILATGGAALTLAGVDTKGITNANDIIEKILGTMLKSADCQKLKTQGERITCLLKAASEYVKIHGKDVFLKEVAKVHLQGNVKDVGDNLANVLIENALFAQKNGVDIQTLAEEKKP